MENIGYYNGTFAPMEQLSIPALDRGVYFGDGVYEALRVERHRFFRSRSIFPAFGTASRFCASRFR